mgnify:CR=1 FL=1
MINKIYFDGGSALHMICIYDKNRNQFFTEKIDTPRTNNELEYLALMKAIKYANNYYNSLNKVLFLGDSELIIKQMTGENKITKSHLKKLYNEIIEEINLASLINFESNFKWIPRSENMAGVVLEKMLNKIKSERNG